ACCQAGPSDRELLSCVPNGTGIARNKRLFRRDAKTSTRAACAPQTTARRSRSVPLLREMQSKQPERSFPFLRINERKAKPRTRGLTEIRAPYYSVVGRRYLEDLFELVGEYVDSLKFAGGSFA